MNSFPLQLAAHNLTILATQAKLYADKEAMHKIKTAGADPRACQMRQS